MKKFLFFISMALFSMGLFAEEAQGYYITFESDTVYVTFIGMWGGEPDIKT